MKIDSRFLIAIVIGIALCILVNRVFMVEGATPESSSPTPVCRNRVSSCVGLGPDQEKCENSWSKGHDGANRQCRFKPGWKKCEMSDDACNGVCQCPLPEYQFSFVHDCSRVNDQVIVTKNGVKLGQGFGDWLTIEEEKMACEKSGCTHVQNPISKNECKALSLRQCEDKKINLNKARNPDGICQKWGENIGKECIFQKDHGFLDFGSSKSGKCVNAHPEVI